MTPPHELVIEQFVTGHAAQALGALFDDGLCPPDRGNALPPLWHWAVLSRWVPASRTGADGHESPHQLLPPVRLPRRMFAGGVVTFHRPIIIGTRVATRARVVSVEEKRGRSGELIVVVVESEIFDEHGALLLEERQDIIYREAATIVGTATLPGPPIPGRRTGGVLRRSDDGYLLYTDPEILMRFSALTSNGHRIHYDWPYATQVEGYPGLVVQGPLRTLALAESHRLGATYSAPRRAEHQHQAPLFCGQSAHIRDTGDDPRRRLVLIGAARDRTEAPLTTLELS